MWVGGLSHDIPTGFVESTFEFLDYFEPKVDELENIHKNKLMTPKLSNRKRMPFELGTMEVLHLNHMKAD